MVYCGKPSKGCSNCRERKIRCDQKEPGCGQCEKRQQTCPGYRNIVDLMFRDESSHVINKAAKTRSRNPSDAQSRVRSRSRKKNTAVTAASSSEGPTPSPTPSIKPKPSPSSVQVRRSVLASLALNATSPSSAESLTSPDEGQGNDPADNASTEDDDPAPYVLDPSLQERGTAFFFSRYVATDNAFHQNYSFIYDIWKPPDQAAGQPIDCVTASMTAVGLAGLSQLTGSRETMTHARKSYGIALKLTHAALRDPTGAIKDTTMLAVLILGSYEIISGRSPQTMQAWQDHVKGASILASMRGSAQFQTKAGIRMFIMLSHSVLISCIQSGLPMPQAMVKLRDELQQLQHDDSPTWAVMDPIYRALQVRYDIKAGKLQNVDDIVQQLSDIDDEFTVLLSQLPSSWQYQSVQLTRPDPRVLGRVCHVYPGLMQATTWNSVRAIRILLLETILEQFFLGSTTSDLTSLAPHHRAQLARCLKLLELLGQAIVASIPQHFGVVSFRDVHSPATKAATVNLSTSHQPYRAPSPPTVDEPEPRRGSEPFSSLTMPSLPQPGGQGERAERFMTLASASHTIIWPLYILGVSSTCSPATKDYAISRLHAIHKEAGLEQARVVAEMLEAKQASLITTSAQLANLPPVPKGALPVVI